MIHCTVGLLWFAEPAVQFLQVVGPVTWWIHALLSFLDPSGASTALVLPLGQCLCLIGRKPSPQQTWQWIQSTYFSSYWEGPKPEFPISQMSILFNLRKRILLLPSIFFFRPHYTADWEGKLSKEQDADFLSCLNSNAMAGDTGFSGINRRTRRVRQLLSGLDTTGT